MKKLTAVFVLIALGIVQAHSEPPQKPELSSWLTYGNPWQVAARCYASVLFYPSIEHNGEVEQLIRIISTDPHLSADVSLNKSIFAVQTDRGRTLDLVGKYIYGTFGTLRIYSYDPAEIKHICDSFISKH